MKNINEIFKKLRGLGPARVTRGYNVEPSYMVGWASDSKCKRNERSYNEAN